MNKSWGRIQSVKEQKSRVVEEIKSVLEVENKIVVVSSYGLTPCCSGRDNGDLIFKTVLEMSRR